MTILSVAQQVSSVIGVARPQALFPNAGSDRTARELVDLANEMAQRIAYDTRDWTALSVAAALPDTGHLPGIMGVPFTMIPLPANFKRLLLNSSLWRMSAPSLPMRFIADYNEWVQRQLRGHFDSRGAWIINNRQIHIITPLAASDTAGFLYLQKNCIAPMGDFSLFSDVFENDADQYRLDERLLKLGMIWQWKANKGSPYAEDMANYQDTLANIAGADKPAPVLIDRLPISAATSMAYPYPIVLGPGGAPI